MIVVLKSNANISFDVEGRTHIIKGYGVINEIDPITWNDIKTAYAQSIEQMSADGYLVVSDTKNASTKNASDDTMQSIVNKQKKDIAKGKQKLKVGDKTIEVGVEKL